MRLHVTRIKEGEGLKQAITAFAAECQLSSGIIISAVGSLNKAVLRMAGAHPAHQDIRDYDGPLRLFHLLAQLPKMAGYIFISQFPIKKAKS